MGHNPLSQGDFLVIENHKGQRNVIKIMQNNEAIQLLHTQPERQLRLIPLTGDEVQEAISAGRRSCCSVHVTASKHRVEGALKRRVRRGSRGHKKRRGVE